MTQETNIISSLAALLRADVLDVDPAHDAAERDRLVEAVLVRRSRSRWQRHKPAMRLTGGIALAAAVMTALIIAWPDAALDYQIQGAALAEGGYVRAETQDAKVTFSEGSDVLIARGSVARIVDVGPHGARLVLEAGHASLSITHLEETEWSIAAGPFVVEVTGTRFAVDWHAARQQLEVTLDEGSVLVRGPLLADGVTLREGQKLFAELPARRVEIAELGDAPAAREKSAAPAAEKEAASVQSVVPPAPAERVPWSKRVASGEFQIVLDEAQARGIESVLASGSLDDLMALSDAARYAARGDLAQRALTSVRSRFSSSDAARTAAFLLGRLAEGGSSSAAIDWYDRYLAEAPGGTFAAEALGRKMLLLRSRAPAQARGVAEQYLRRFPKGAYAQVARDLLGK